MKTIVKIKLNEFEADGLPTTQEDNYGNIFDRWDLFQNLVIDNQNVRTKVARLVKYADKNYAIFPNIGFQRYDFYNNDVQFHYEDGDTEL